MIAVCERRSSAELSALALLTLLLATLPISGCTSERPSEETSHRQSALEEDQVGSVTLPGSTDVHDMALAANGVLKISDRARVLREDGTHALVTNAGTQETRYGVSGHSGTVISHAPVVLQNNATVHGDAASSGLIEKRAGASVTGVETQNVQLPSPKKLTWEIEPPSVVQSGITVESGTATVVSPGCSSRPADEKQNEFDRLRVGG